MFTDYLPSAKPLWLDLVNDVTWEHSGEIVSFLTGQMGNFLLQQTVVCWLQITDGMTDSVIINLDMYVRNCSEIKTIIYWVYWRINVL